MILEKQLSCTTQLAVVFHDILKHNDKGKVVHATVLTSSKAFDVMNHSILIFKLIKLKINPFIIKWVKYFLQGRSNQNVL